MKKQDFFEELIDVLELEEDVVDEKTSIELDSLGVLSIIAFFDENFEMKVSADKLSDVATIGDLIQLVGEDRLS